MKKRPPTILSTGSDLISNVRNGICLYIVWTATHIRYGLSSGAKFCAKCGATLPENATFCPTCGSPVAGAPAQQAPTGSATPGRRYDRYEKHEKQEKHEKNEKNEKGRGGDISGAITGGLILIWLGITFYLAQSGRVSWDNWWELFLIGLGAVLIVQGVIRYAQNRTSFIGTMIGGVIILLIGLVFYIGADVGDLWPLVLVVIGIAVLVSAVLGRRRVPTP